MDKFTDYILNKIAFYKNDTKKNPEEKDINNALIMELVECLAEYTISKRGE
jgi:hypothetical protein